METKSRRRIFVGYDDGSKSIKYYNAGSRKVLVSQNVRFLSLTNDETPLEPIIITPDAPDEGESEGNIPTTLGNKGNSIKRKRDDEEELEPEQRRTRGRWINYRYLADPFPDEEEDETTFTTNENVYAIIAGDEYTSLKDARNSIDWPEWEKAIQKELTQLYQMGTWRLADKPKDAIPIANKWIFVRKSDKSGEIVKYKVRLVAKGCTQRPRYNYVETFSPVVRMDTIRAILEIVPIKGLKIHQLDIKGAYLNGTLKEKVYMRQPEGYGDDTDSVCELLKTIWSKTIRLGMEHSVRQKHERIWLQSYQLRSMHIYQMGWQRCGDTHSLGRRHTPIHFIWQAHWANSIRYMNCMGNNRSWGTYKNCRDRNYPKSWLSQKLYINSILERKGLSGINSVTTPMDPNIKL
jgi:reverse transcriptase-like protein